jgi:hypothetical protein
MKSCVEINSMILLEGSCFTSYFYQVIAQDERRTLFVFNRRAEDFNN